MMIMILLNIVDNWNYGVSSSIFLAKRKDVIVEFTDYTNSKMTSHSPGSVSTFLHYIRIWFLKLFFFHCALILYL